MASFLRQHGSRPGAPGAAALGPLWVQDLPRRSKAARHRSPGDDAGRTLSNGASWNLPRRAGSCDASCRVVVSLCHAGSHQILAIRSPGPVLFGVRCGSVNGNYCNQDPTARAIVFVQWKSLRRKLAEAFTEFEADDQMGWVADVSMLFWWCFAWTSNA